MASLSRQPLSWPCDIPVSLRLSLCLVSLVMLASPAPAFAATIPVAGSGTDCNPATQSCAPALPGLPITSPPNCQPGTGGATVCGSGPASLGNNSGTNQGASNPINVISGNKYQREDDMPALPGVLGLEIVRHYNSAYSTASTSTGILGRGWKLSYETDLYAIGNTIQIIQADGSRIMFNRDPNNRSLCSTSNPADGRLRIHKTRRGDDYIWRWTTGQELRFDPDGKLVQILAPTGEFVSLQHDIRGLLVQVTDPQGRQLQLQYPGKATAAGGDRFRGVMSIGSPVGTFSYHYGNALPAGARADKLAVLPNLVRVDMPEPGISRLYHHEDALHPTYLTGISVGDSRSGKAVIQRIGTYAYDIDGKAILTVRGTPLPEKAAPGSQPARAADESGISQVTLDYAAPGMTLLTNSLGQTTTFRHAILAGEFRLLEVRGAGCYHCGDTNVRYGYDKLGRLTMTTRLDQTGQPLDALQTERDTRGRTLRISRIAFVNGKPQPAQLQQRYIYPDDDNAMSETIVRPSVIAGKASTTTINRNDRGQVVRITDQAWSPGIDRGEAPFAIARITTFRYASINGRSVLTDVSGPFAPGPSVSAADPGGMHAEWDGKGNAIAAFSTPGNGTSALRYDAAGRIASVTGADGHRTEYRYDFRHQLLSSSTDGVTRLVQRDAQGYPVEVGERNGTAYTAAVRFGVDSAGRIRWTASPLGMLQSDIVDTEGKVLESTLQSANFKQVQRYAYDSAGRPVASTDSAGGTQRIRWNPRGLPDAVTDALGREKRYDYDANGHLAQVTEAANTALARFQATRTQFGRDAAGRLQSVTAPNGATTRYDSDDFGRTVVITSADSGRQTRRFDAAGRLSVATDANGNQVRYAYDAAGRLLQHTVVDVSSTDPAKRDVQTRWTYQGKHLLALDYPGQAEHYVRDTTGRLVRKEVVLAGANGITTTSSRVHTYDARGQLQGSSLPDGSVITYERNGQNQVVATMRNRIQTPWLRWLLPGRTLVTNMERDLVGLRHLAFGNGIEANYQRSREGVLARIVYRQPDSAGQRPTTGMSAWFGVGAAQASTMPGAPPTLQDTGPLALPGALGLPPDPLALLDYRYLWDLQGNLIQTQGTTSQNTYGYDARDRLVVSARTPTGNPAATSLPAASHARYLYDGAGNRLLSQENISDPDETRNGTVRYVQATASNRWRGSTPQQDVINDPAGQPNAIGQRSFHWDAQGRLTEVRQQDRPLASYRYNHRGERIGKTAGGKQTQYLYENRQLVAELDESGRIHRQYVYLADQPIAVIDTPDGVATGSGTCTATTCLVTDLKTLWRAWFGSDETLTYLHNNHLGATELATDVKGKLVWRAAYSAYGTVTAVAVPRSDTRPSGKPPFTLNLRLPGQYADEETGLYYNDHRYYDPQRGQYLTPDPLGLRGGINSYAYVANNPLKFVDPSGLILFAFDGSGNDESDPMTLSNVVRFRRAYRDGEMYYITGVGTEDPPTGIKPRAQDLGGLGDIGFAYTGKPRIAAMIKNLEVYADSVADDTAVDIDITGFSRGAAEGRDFANQVVGNTTNGYYRYIDKVGNAQCQKVNFRFIGLFDTVLSEHTGAYELRIPDVFQYVAQAMALNEYRGINIKFPFESILGVPASNDRVRIERGFLGSHSDIGGGFPDQDMAKIALVWMVNQAKLAGIKMEDVTLTLPATPVIHDKSQNLLFGAQTGGPTATSEDRDVRYEDGTVVKQRKATTGLMTYNDTRQFIQYKANPNSRYSIAGSVDTKGYLEWLNKHDYDIPLSISQGKP